MIADDLDDNPTEIKKDNPVLKDMIWKLADDGTIILPFTMRSKFRPKLQEYFAELEKSFGWAKNGTYIQAENLTKQFFYDTEKIPFEAWEYRK